MSSSGRNLTLTEELEKLEQSITLTLQEIDHNFSKAHRIVTTSILPLVEQYGEHSKSVWEASKFWKQFFEASANVSLSGYEELAGEDETTAAETTVADTTTDYTVTQDNEGDNDDLTAEQSGYQEHHQRQKQQRGDVEESLLDDAEMTGSTPRAPISKSLKSQQQRQQQQQQHVADFDSPYEKLRRELKDGDGDGDDAGEDTVVLVDTEGENAGTDDNDDTMELPPHGTATATTRLPDMTMTGRSSSLLFDDPTLQRRLQSPERKSKDPLLHRVLDKNYRIQATPHKGTTLTAAGRGLGLTPGKDRDQDKDQDRTRRALWADSPMSSPEMAIPKLRSDLYMSPAKAARGRRVQAGRAAAAGEPPRTPGVSVQTPTTARKTKDVFADGGKGKGKDKAKRGPDEIKWESDDSEEDTGGVLFGGMSPPKTIQFALPPSKLMQTPAREASRRIVDDILISAGAAPADADGEGSEYSPTMVKMNKDILDDTF